MLKIWTPVGARARATGGCRYSASNPPIILWILGYVSQSVSHAGLPSGYQRGASRLTVGGTGETKKNPRQQGILSRVPVAGGKLGVPVGDIWVYPRGLTIPLYCSDSHPSRVWRNIFFP